MSDNAPSPTEKSVDVVVESTERFRSRALSAAALTGAAAAVVASTVLEPSATPTSVDRLLTIAAAFVFGLATASFLIAAMLRVERRDGWRGIVGSITAPWRLSVEPSGEITGIERLSWQAKALRSRVTRAMDVGMWLTTASALLLSSAVLVSLIVDEGLVAVRVISATELQVPGCQVGRSFDALVLESDLETQHLVRVILEPSVCGGESVSMYLPVESVQLQVRLRE